MHRQSFVLKTIERVGEAGREAGWEVIKIMRIEKLLKSFQGKRVGDVSILCGNTFA